MHSIVTPTGNEDCNLKVEAQCFPGSRSGSNFIIVLQFGWFEWSMNDILSYLPHFCLAGRYYRLVFVCLVQCIAVLVVHPWASALNWRSIPKFSDKPWVMFHALGIYMGTCVAVRHCSIYVSVETLCEMYGAWIVANLYSGFMCLSLK